MCNTITAHLRIYIVQLTFDLGMVRIIMLIILDDYVLLWLTFSHTSTIKGKLLNFIKAVEHNNPFLLTATRGVIKF
ncbi:hypothetical protein T11_18044 [Trichinella zimbabwensis]|uniref:Uncharacterized protein n=1 Tax=Trichinella zimbabwensis TaxID=268475 RepID=A0A0V1I1Z0_9BILA|nr:hypothetical protein T11_18044 [Trichinella zimbabwensis]